MWGDHLFSRCFPEQGAFGLPQSSSLNHDFAVLGAVQRVKRCKPYGEWAVISSPSYPAHFLGSVKAEFQCGLCSSSVRKGVQIHTSRVGICRVPPQGMFLCPTRYLLQLQRAPINRFGGCLFIVWFGCFFFSPVQGLLMLVLLCVLNLSSYAFPSLQGKFYPCDRRESELPRTL